MEGTPHRVAIVVDREFGERLLALAEGVGVWICDTPANRAWIDRAWATVPEWQDRGVTSFSVREGDAPEAMALGLLADVDRHHGLYAHDPSWSALSFYGVGPTGALREALAEYGVDRFEATPDGFVASREVRET